MAGPAPPAQPPTTTTAQEQAALDAEARLQALLALGDVSQANAATGLYGDSGTGKTSLCATAVEYTFRRYGRITRYYAADLGGFGNKLLRLIRLGMAQVWNPTNHIEPFETMEDASLGYWPEKIDDPFIGYAQPDVKLIPPQITLYAIYCGAGHEVRTVVNKSLLTGFSVQCPTCKTLTTPQNWGHVDEITRRAPGVKHVGLRVYDSATSLQDWAMQDMALRSARGDLGGEGSALGREGKIISGKYTFGANNRAHYGFAQNRMQAWIKNARSIPGQVVPPIFTFLELRSTDDQKGVPIYGPKMAGNAKTADVPAWLGNCLHTSKEENDKGKYKHRLWLETHIDKGSIVPHLAKTRAEPGTMPPFLEDPDEGPEFSICSLDRFFTGLEQALEVGTRQDAIDYPTAPLFQPFVDDQEADELGRKSLSGAALATPAGGARPSVSGGAPRAVAPPAGQRAGTPTALTTGAQPKPAAPTPTVVGPKLATPVVAAPKPGQVAQAPKPPAPKPPAPPPAVAPVTTPPAPAMDVAPAKVSPAGAPAGVGAGQAAPAKVAAPPIQPMAAPVRPPAVSAVGAPAVAKPVPVPPAQPAPTPVAPQPAAQPIQPRLPDATARPIATAPAPPIAARPTAPSVPSAPKPAGRPPVPPPGVSVRKPQ